MIIMQADVHNLYLHQANQFDYQPGYILVYGLEVTHMLNRVQAVRRFAQCLDHAEENEPIYGELT